MLGPTDLRNGALTDAAIERLCRKYRRYALRTAGYWCGRYFGRIDAAELESTAMLQVWRSLRSWRADAGRSMGSWVRRGVWDRVRTTAARLHQQRIALREVAMPSRQIRRGDPILPSRLRTDRDVEAAESIAIARSRLDGRDRELFDRVMTGWEPAVKMAREWGVSPQAVDHRLKRVRERVSA